MTGLGPVLCWAVVFADIGTSVYYAPGILFHQVGQRAALFVAMTLVVFVLLTIKYAEVAVRYPQGGGVVSVGAHAGNHLVGLVGGLFILVDYFLTAALSALSGVIYLSVVLPGIHGLTVLLTVLALVLLAGLNLIGISADAKVTMVVALLAFTSQVLVVVAVIVHVGPAHAAGAVRSVLHGPPLGAAGLLTGYAGAFLAFSGLESISQLAPAMRAPGRLTAPRSMTLVVVTVAVTSPLLTLWATTLLRAHSVDPNQFVSSLAGFAAGPAVAMEVAASAALLLVFASNTAIIGCYHVFLALSRMRFLPRALQQRNRLRQTPHWAIVSAVVIPILVVVLSGADTSLLGDMYAFGLLGAFGVTCVSLDVVRWRERRRAHMHPRARHPERPVSGLMFAIGVLTSALVVTAWATNLVAKPLATLFGGAVTACGLLVAGITHHRRVRRGQPGPPPVAHRLEAALARHPLRGNPVLAVLPAGGRSAESVVEDALREAGSAHVVVAFIGVSSGSTRPAPRLREIVDPYLGDEAAHRAFRAVARATPEAARRRVHRVYVNRPGREAAVAELEERFRPRLVLGG